jgi:hypothetical protein
VENGKSRPGLKLDIVGQDKIQKGIAQMGELFATQDHVSAAIYIVGRAADVKEAILSLSGSAAIEPHSVNAVISFRN